MNKLSKNEIKGYWKAKQALKDESFDEIKFINWLTKRYFVEISPEGEKPTHCSCINVLLRLWVFLLPTVLYAHKNKRPLIFQTCWRTKVFHLKWSDTKDKSRATKFKEDPSESG